MYEIDDARFIRDVRQELVRARAKFPDTRHQLNAFSEEAGELVKAVMDHDQGKGTPGDVYNEAVQAAAMAVRVATEGDSTLSYRGAYAEGLWLE